MSNVSLSRPVLTVKRELVPNQLAQASVPAPPSTVLTPRTLSVWWPRQRTPHAHWAIEHPSGGVIFGHLPEMVTPNHKFETGPVHLLFGEHWSRHQGYGVVHILAGHWRDMRLSIKNATPEAVAAVATFVSRVITRRASIHCEFASMRGKHKPVVVKGGSGTVVLAPMREASTGQPYYSVVTAFRGTNAKGPKIGTL